MTTFRWIYFSDSWHKFLLCFPSHGRVTSIGSRPGHTHWVMARSHPQGQGQVTSTGSRPGHIHWVKARSHPQVERIAPIISPACHERRRKEDCSRLQYCLLKTTYCLCSGFSFQCGQAWRNLQCVDYPWQIVWMTVLACWGRMCRAEGLRYSRLL